MVNMKIEHSLLDFEGVKALLEVMAANYDELPTAVQYAVKETLSDKDPSEYDWDYFKRLGLQPWDVSIYIDGALTKHVMSGSRIGRLVKVLGMPPERVGSFWAVSDGEFICGWGNKPVLTNGEAK